VSEETAEAMAVGARRRTGSTFALSITGEAGPEPRENVPVGTVYVALADASGCQVAHRQFMGDRARIRVFATQMALDMLRKKCTLVAM
jgi:nicotinamide-nucleotide amidase